MGKALLNVRHQSGRAFLTPNHEPEATEHQHTVTVVDLDRWCQDTGLPLEQVSFLKVDVEGSELDVKTAAWQIEISRRNVTRVRRSFEHLLRMLEGGFRWFLDLRRHDGVRRIAKLRESLSCMFREPRDKHTDLLLLP